MSIKIRAATVADAASLVDLLAQLGYEADPVALPERLDAIRQRGGEVLIAELDGSVLGCVNMLVDVRLAEGRTGEIVSLAVTESHRGAGIGKQLTLSAIAWLQTRQCTTVRVRANAVRTDAHQFYAKLGFKEIKTQKIFIKQVQE